MFGKHINRILENEHFFEFSRPMKCPYCKEEIRHIKVIVGRGTIVKLPIGRSESFLGAYLCPACESVLGTGMVGGTQSPF